jgi:hypothetical protein
MTPSPLTDPQTTDLPTIVNTIYNEFPVYIEELLQFKFYEYAIACSIFLLIALSLALWAIHRSYHKPKFENDFGGFYDMLILGNELQTHKYRTWGILACSFISTVLCAYCLMNLSIIHYSPRIYVMEYLIGRLN